MVAAERWALLNLSRVFFFTHTPPTEIYPLSLHDALPISRQDPADLAAAPGDYDAQSRTSRALRRRSEEHTSELQSHVNVVCRLLLEKKKVISTQLHLCDSTFVITRVTARRPAPSSAVPTA